MSSLARTFFASACVLGQSLACGSSNWCEDRPYPVQAPLVGDFTGDGRVDVVVRSFDGYSLFRQADDGLDSAEMVFEPGGLPGHLFALELGGDPQVAFFRFQAGWSLFVGSGLSLERRPLDGIICQRLLGTGDVDGDGHADVVCVASGSNDPGEKLFVMHGRGGGDFAPSREAGSYEDCRGAIVASLADFDGDERMDILVGCRAHELLMLRGDGQGDFEARWVHGQGHTIGIAAGDFNGDGRLEAVTVTANGGVNACETRAAVLHVYAGLGETPPSGNGRVYEVGIEPANLTVGDLDGDGVDDIVLGDSSTQLGALYLVLSSDGLDMQVIEGPVTGVALADLDSDGDLDLVTTNYPFMSVHENLGGGEFASARNYPVDVEER